MNIAGLEGQQKLQVPQNILRLQGQVRRKCSGLCTGASAGLSRDLYRVIMVEERNSVVLCESERSQDGQF
jgi:hypothetical protein